MGMACVIWLMMSCMANQSFFAVLQNAQFWPTSEAISVPMGTILPFHVPVRHANPLFGCSWRMLMGLEHVICLMVSCMTHQNFLAVLQNAQFWPHSEAKSVAKDTATPIHVPVRHANPLFGSIERKVDGLAHAIWLMG